MAAARNNEFKLVGPRDDEMYQSDSVVTLSCHLSPEISAVAMDIRWFMGTDCVCLYKNRQVTEGRGYEGRVSLFTQELQRGNISLQIRDCRESDRGDYLCQVTNGDTTEEITVELGLPVQFQSAPIEPQRETTRFPKVCIYQTDRKWTKEERLRMEQSARWTEKAVSGVNLSTAAAEKFLPEMVENTLKTKNNNLFRFLCPFAGQFQCRFTNLVFEMEGEGEVLYRIDSWDPRFLDGLGQMQPAGPLYSIDCFEGSLSHLHLPHCEIQYEENQVELVVAHFTGDNTEIIQPLNVTNTHVIINIQGLSLFGLLKKMILHPSPINAQVLIFYKEMMDTQKRKTLYIHLLPENVPVKEVEQKHKGVSYFETSSTCELIPGKRYRPRCDPYVSEPRVAKFKCDYGPNYHPTFVVFLQAEEVTVSLLDKHGKEVWEPHQILLTTEETDAVATRVNILHSRVALATYGHFWPPLSYISGHSTETSPSTTERGAAFVDEHRKELIQRVSSVMEMVDCLHSKNMITAEMYSNIQTATPSQKQMRILYSVLDSGGKAVKAEFHKVLKQKQPFLVAELESGPSRA